MRTIAVVGASLAGLTATRALRDQGFEGRIVVIGEEARAPYDRPPLSKEFLAGKFSEADLELSTPEDDALEAEWRLGRTATGLDTGDRAVVLDDGERIAADGVVVATGARARSLRGELPDGVHTLRTFDDAVALREELVPGARLVIIGAGFIGSEIASTAVGLGVEVDVVEAARVPLLKPLGAEMGEVCAGLHATEGVRLHTGAMLAELVGGERVTAVRLSDGRELPADVVVVGIGAEPCVEWLHGSGVDLDDGVVTDAQGATNVPGVFAVGDCANSHRNYLGSSRRLEHWTNAVQQPVAAASALLGRSYEPPAHHEVPYFWSDQYGHKIQFAGHRTEGSRIEVLEGSLEALDFLALYRGQDGNPEAVLAIDRARPFGRWRRQLAGSMPALR
ncbi:Reductase C-terminal [Saccharopolyspora antimicrobica]|uniref:NAD/ferredoxin-dependent reductase-like protein n=1 Tax=Saccharopolyspora antimicrobica TaxID=455193 RepID=A0A1I5CD00_9PSEU|nr:FAD-dependent oxidoreductase [Saccharopolyspora antimicrobica]RKT88896.1 NAD/ferredoxin-dependent reductase-like protein [Saccharopolyspora antimicrobica]SFN84858.1 Reductase C-terminal [Saccharopolyspora antimicrobica]